MCESTLSSTHACLGTISMHTDREPQFPKGNADPAPVKERRTPILVNGTRAQKLIPAEGPEASSCRCD